MAEEIWVYVENEKPDWEGLLEMKMRKPAARLSAESNRAVIKYERDSVGMNLSQVWLNLRQIYSTIVVLRGLLERVNILKKRKYREITRGMRVRKCRLWNRRIKKLRLLEKVVMHLMGIQAGKLDILALRTMGHRAIMTIDNSDDFELAIQLRALYDFHGSLFLSAKLGPEWRKMRKKVKDKKFKFTISPTLPIKYPST